MANWRVVVELKAMLLGLNEVVRVGAEPVTVRPAEAVLLVPPFVEVTVVGTL
jgi:hypothetical protein